MFRLARNLLLYWLSIHWNAVGIFAPADFDQGDTGNPTYRNWGDGRANFFGLTAAHAERNWDDLVADFPHGIGHNMRSFCYSYDKDYPKRAVRVSSVAFVALEAVAVVGWLV